MVKRKAKRYKPKQKPAQNAAAASAEQTTPPPSRTTSANDAESEREELSKLFHKVAGEDKEIDFNEWVSLCINDVKLNLEEFELRRVFDTVDKDASKKINEEEFFAGLGQLQLLRSIAQGYRAMQAAKFQIPDSFDATKTTNENYKAEVSVGFAPKFQNIRKQLDYGYHVNYSLERQKWQDAVITTTAIRCEPQPSPWVVFTCGGMGAGKGFVLSWMSKSGFFPLENVVHVDPDYFKSVMPEWSRYVAQDSLSAGAKCQHESGFMAEIAQEVAMQNKQNLWIDGSLRDGKWYSGVFDSLRRRFPDYRIAIFYVYAPEETVRQRAKERAEKTGRAVPESLILESLAAPKETLSLLTRKSDFLACICNDTVPPKLEAFETIDRSGDFSVIRTQFKSQKPPTHFPNSLAPLRLRTSASLHKHASLQADTVVVKDDAFEGNEALAALREQLHDSHSKQGWRLRCSPQMVVTLGANMRAEVLIPREATTFAFVAPSLPPSAEYRRSLSFFGTHSRAQAESSGEDSTKQPELNTEVSLARNGGFVYFDNNNNVLCVNAIMGFAVDVPSAAGTNTDAIMQFAEPTPLTQKVADRLKSRMFSVTWSRLVEYPESDQIKLAWVNPAEEIGSSRYTANGGFLFVQKGKPHFPAIFEVASST